MVDYGERVLPGNEAAEGTAEFKRALDRLREELEARGVDPGSLLGDLTGPEAAPDGESKRRRPTAILRSKDILLVERWRECEACHSGDCGRG